ncbi:hypothetical protein LTR36_000445 [Oleoguttula mirabilis]|uniref:CMP/dCMP-type deaminase domain-containing protein n=1 Tax=Oleoguttula mirabilis TaxID=1507867 RepID=A0AAV9JZ12_9PEZI|nr:hypothetical protein LTR36_000445 [Oleoguttula mirabilis]
MEQVRSFTAKVFAHFPFPPLLRHVFHFQLHLLAAFNRARHAIMGLPIDSKAASLSGEARKRQMLHLKTKEECRLGNETIQVWTVELPSKHAEGILKVIKDNVEHQDAIDLQHLRRFAKPKYLPQHVLGRRDLVKEMYLVPQAWEASAPTVMQMPDATWEWSTASKMRTNNRPPTLYLMVCPSETISLRDLHDLMLQHPPFCSSPDSWAYPLEIKEITVPRLAPTSPDQAKNWSDMYWPTFYRKTNPFGAHPTTIEKAETDLQTPLEDNISVEQALELADYAGSLTEKEGFGICTGCAIVERVDDKTEIIAVAGDARRKPLPSEIGVDALNDNDDANDTSITDSQDGTNVPISANERTKARREKRKKKKAAEKAANEAETSGCTSGNVMSHAVMRAIGMVGRKRLRVASQPISAESNFAAAGLEHNEEARDAFFLDLPVNPLEQQYFEKDNLKPDGYLCLKLEIFLTHEPCMMCSMALVHSRVGRVIFKHRMPKTGGLTAETVSNDTGPVGLGYGLCWRKELNWQFTCWEYNAAGKRAAGDGTADDNKHLNLLPSCDNANVGKLSFNSIHV